MCGICGEDGWRIGVHTASRPRQNDRCMAVSAVALVAGVGMAGVKRLRLSRGCRMGVRVMRCVVMRVKSLMRGIAGGVRVCANRHQRRPHNQQTTYYFFHRWHFTSVSSQ